MGRGCDPFLFVLVTLIPPILAFLVGFLIWQTGLGQYLAFGAIMYLLASMDVCVYAMARHG
jgi:hypothetical protein